MEQGLKTTTLLVALVFSIVMAGLISLAGRKRKIGAGWSFFFSLFLTFIIGGIMTFMSAKVTPETPPSEPENVGLKKTLGVILIVFGALSVIGQLIRISNGYPAQGIGFAIGFIGLGIYLFQLTKPRMFNDRNTNL